MVSRAAGREAGVCGDAPVYARRRPERTLLYQIIEEYYPELEHHLASRGSGLPRYVAKEFEAFLDCGRLERGFLRVRCDGCGLEHLVAFSCKRRGFTPGFLPFALRASLRLFKIAPGDFVAPSAGRDGWRRQPHTWRTRCSRTARCGSGC